MSAPGYDIIRRLQKEILPLQGFKPLRGSAVLDGGLGVIRSAFPNALFPLGAIHEFFCKGIEDVTASAAFICGLLSTLISRDGIVLWITSGRIIFPPALKIFCIAPEKVIFIELQSEKEILWVMEEALKCEGLAGVVAEVPEISFTESRRFQLAVEQSRVTGFIIRNNPRNLATTCIARWKITPLPTPKSDLPGVGSPRWQVGLLKVRNGIPGTWKLQWAAGKFKHVYELTAVHSTELRRKTG